MLFNSLEFAVFFLIVFLAYYIVPSSYRWGVILAANFYFYLGFGIRNFVILFAVTLITFILTADGGVAFAKSERSDKVKYALSLFICLGLLLVFKYAGFLFDTIDKVAGITLPFTEGALKLIAPVGISFYTFKLVSYVVDVKKHKMMPVNHFGKFAAYISFFPQIASGPIERPESFFEKLEKNGCEGFGGIKNFGKDFSYEKGIHGIMLIVWGLFKKLIVADKLASYVDKVYANPEAFSGFSLVAVIFFFTIQIYCDFSGYSSIANGCSELLGFGTVDNFKNPYFSSSVKQFWSRWHISLSTWFRDYVYIPLGGNRKGSLRYAINIVITFLVSGLWHGAAWTFVLWGGLHGVMQVLETLGHKLHCKISGIDPRDKSYTNKGIYKWISILFVFLFVNISWVFFKSTSLQDAFYVLSHVFVGISSPVGYIKGGLQALGINSGMLLHLLMVIGMLTLVDALSLKMDVTKLVSKLPTPVRIIIGAVLIDLIVIWFLQYGADSSSFVYFNF